MTAIRRAVVLALLAVWTFPAVSLAKPEPADPAPLPAAITSAAAAAEPGWQMVRDVPFVAQRSERDCGAAALAMVLAYWRAPATLDEIEAVAPVEGGGIRAGALRDLARQKGLEAFVVSGTLND